MNQNTIVLLIALLLIAGYASKRLFIKGKNKGGSCCSGCAGCSGCPGRTEDEK